MSIRCFHSFKLLAPGVAVALLVLSPATAAGAETPSGTVYGTAVPTVESDPAERAPKPEAPERSRPVHPTERAVSEPDRSLAPTTGEEAAHRTVTKPRSEPGPNYRHHRQESTPVKADNDPPAGSGQPSGRPSDERSSTGVGASAADGGPSPAVPILIAVALVAAASIGFVLYRERKSQAGPAGT